VPQAVAIRLFEQCLTPWLNSGVVWLLGGAIGVDHWALDWLRSAGEECHVVVPHAIADQPKEVRPLLASVSNVTELRLPRGKRAYIERNRYMVDRSSVVIGFWTGQRGGSSWTLRYAIQRGLEVHAYPTHEPA
jgi:predicted Rossmann fold nucleotide-binding protein DprA/Smf involved in DNA uptake